MSASTHASSLELKSTPLDEIPKLHASLQQTFLSGITLPLLYRQTQLLALARMLQENHKVFNDALYADLRKPSLEVYGMEIGPIIERCIIAATNLKEWSKPIDKAPEVQEFQKGWSPKVYWHPKGVALCIAPWNYPLILTLQPLYGAISAGCCALVKPSEVAPNYASLLAEMLPKYLDPRAYKVVLGSVPEITKILELKWDHIFFTGNGQVGRIISQAAAKHLTPLTLELGGKSPVFVDPEHPDLDIVARRIMFGKCCTAGQLCVSPDYVLFPSNDKEKKEALLNAFKKACSAFFPKEEGEEALKSKSLSKMINLNHFKRVTAMISATKGTVITGGKWDEKTLRIEPTIVLFDKEGWEDDALMLGENFGPVLPIVVDDFGGQGLKGATKSVRARDHPLVLYAFTEDEEKKAFIRDQTMSGNLVFNDTVMQLSVNELPFGGVGESGHGRQITRYSFEAFSYARASVDIPLSEEQFLEARYPPHNEDKFKIMAAPVFTPIPDVQSLEH